MSSQKEFHISQEQLEIELEEIDTFLKSQNIPIPGRPLRAISEFSKRHNIGLPISEPIHGTYHESFKYWPITQFIKHWFDELYSGRLGLDMGPGRCVFILRNEPWIFHYPKLFGSFVFGLSREFSSQELEPVDGIAVYNVFESIKNFPNSLRKKATDEELQSILDRFTLGFFSLTILSNIRDSELIKSARADVEAAITHIMSPRPEFGLSKWASLQVAEKYLKYILTVKGINVPKTHNLIVLVDKLKEIGINSCVDEEVRFLQCSPSIRYGEQRVLLDDAINAHHASLSLILKFEHEEN